jgi:hypothetical protein
MISAAVMMISAEDFVGEESGEGFGELCGEIR